MQLTPRRARCRGCGATHVLLPAWCLARRADAGAVIGRALEAKAAGAGHRAVAELLGRPASTVRGWLRALARGAGRVRETFTVLAAGLVLIRRCPRRPGRRCRGCGGGGGGGRRGGGGGAGGGRGGAVGAAAAATCGLLLAPAWPPRVANASWLWAAAR